MISTEKLTSRLDGDWVAFDKHGEVVDYVVADHIGPAILLVSPVTDALKRVDDAERVVDSIDRGSVWMVDVIVLNSTVLSALPHKELSAEELIDSVREAGFTWQISSTSDL